MKAPLRVPARLTVALTGALVFGACAREGATNDGGAALDTALAEASVDAGLGASDAGDDVLRDPTGDACPDPLSCFERVATAADGGLYGESVWADGAVSTARCPPTPVGCPMV